MSAIGSIGSLTYCFIALILVSRWRLPGLVHAALRPALQWLATRCPAACPPCRPTGPSPPLLQGCIYAKNGEGTVGGRDGNSPADKALSEWQAGPRRWYSWRARHACMNAAQAARCPLHLLSPLTRPPASPAGMLSALGSIGFAYTFSLVLLEIQDTLKQPPNAMKTMRKAINISVTAAGAFYLSIACTG